jgi:hypothetical protein
MTFRRAALVCALASFFVARTASATTISYTSLAAFQAAATGLATIDFSGIAPAGSFAVVNGNTISGVTFSTPDNLTVTDPGYGAGYNYGTGATLTSYDFNGSVYLHAPPVTMTLGGATALGFLAADDQSGTTDPGTFTVLLSSGDSFTLSANSSLNFYGFTSTVPITSLTLTNNAAASLVTSIDNVTFGRAVATAPVPEPASLLLFGTGLATAVARRRFNKRK